MRSPGRRPWPPRTSPPWGSPAPAGARSPPSPPRWPTAGCDWTPAPTAPRPIGHCSRCPASGRGPPRSWPCAVSATPTSGCPATSRCGAASPTWAARTPTRPAAGAPGAPTPSCTCGRWPHPRSSPVTPLIGAPHDAAARPLGHRRDAGGAVHRRGRRRSRRPLRRGRRPGQRLDRRRRRPAAGRAPGAAPGVGRAGRRAAGARRRHRVLRRRRDRHRRGAGPAALRPLPHRRLGGAAHRPRWAARHLRGVRRPVRPADGGARGGQRLRPQRRGAVRALPPGARHRWRAGRLPLGHAGEAVAARPRGRARAPAGLRPSGPSWCSAPPMGQSTSFPGTVGGVRHPARMDAASLLLGLLLGALLATAATLGAVALTGRRRPAGAGMEPLHESLDHLHRLLTGMERARATAHGELREQMGTVGQASAQLRQETAALVTALRTPHVRGRWGEVQLRRVVEVAGLLEHCDFVEQPSAVNDQGAGVRPDLVVTLSDGRQVVVDAKVPFTGYIEAVQATDQAVRDQRVQLHARQLRAHVDALAGRLTRLGSALGTTMTRFNETVGSYERSVLTAARRFDDLGIAESPVPEPEQLEATIRTLRPAESPEDDLDESRDGTTG